jgi:hypothetical protein
MATVPAAGAEHRIVWPGPRPGELRIPGGELTRAPEGWVFVPPGDAMLTRRIKAAGPVWVVEAKIGKRTQSVGIWAPGHTVARLRLEVEAERTNPDYQKKLDAGRKRRDKEQQAYVADFEASVFAFLGFAPRYEALARQLAHAVAEHATPVGSGTVARTERIPIEERARAAVIAWMRHQTTRYDNMKIARVAGLRREVRRDLARESLQLIAQYRRGVEVDATTCPLQQALATSRLPDSAG